MSKGLQKLKAQAPARRFRTTATPLFRWLATNQEEIRMLFSDGPVTWSEVIDAAQEDGIEVENTVREQRSCSRKWTVLTAKRNASDGTNGDGKSGHGKHPHPTSIRLGPNPNAILPEGTREGSSPVPSRAPAPALPAPESAGEKTSFAVAETPQTLTSGRRVETEAERDARVEAQTQRALRMVSESLVRRGGEPIKGLKHDDD